MAAHGHHTIPAAAATITIIAQMSGATRKQVSAALAVAG